MPLNPRRVRLLVGCLGVALLAAIPALSSRTVSPAAPRISPAPAAPLLEPVPAATAPSEPIAAEAPVATVAQKIETQSVAWPSGMMAYLDEFGNLVQSPSEPLPTESSSIPLLRTPDSQLSQTQLTSGGVMVQLDETFQEFSIVRRDASGKLLFDCLPAPEAAKAIDVQPAAPAALPEE